MEQLVYISTARSERIAMEDVDSILRTSRRNNARDGLTGLLVVGSRRFLQVLEGPADRIQTALERIRGDARHFAIVELSRRTITERSFPSWSMGYEPAGAGLSATVDKLTAHISDPNLQAQVRSFAELHSKAA